MDRILKRPTPTVRQALLALLVLILIIIPAIAHQFAPKQQIAILYALPIVIAGQVFRPRAASIFIALALIGYTVDSIRDQASVLIWATQFIVLLIVAFLGIHSKEQQRSESRLIEALQEERQEREQFTGAVVHEMRNVLSIILGYATILARQEKGRTQTEQQALASIESQSHRLDRLVQDLQTVSRIERGVLELHREQCDLNQMAQNVVKDAQHLTTRHHIVLNMGNDPLIGMWDCGRLQQTLDNLVRNAIRYSPKGGTISVDLAKVDGIARVAVSDQGIGIAKADIAKLFKPYARLRPEISREGLGLGLYISQQIIKQHGGRIWVESTLGEGSKFIFEVPLVQIEKTTNPE